MNVGLSSADRDLLVSLRSFIDSSAPESLEIWDKWNPPGDHSLERDEARRFVGQLGEEGWLGIDLPVECGGRGASSVQAHLVFRELATRNLPSGGQGVWSVAPALLRHASEDLKARFLPGILHGDIHFALGLTEPSGGTDLASITTRADRQGDEYIINGQKAFTTGQHWATHMWLAVRTSIEERRHHGISVLIVPADAPGITVTPMHTQAGERTNMVYLDEVRVPTSERVGEEGNGFRILMEAVDYERLALSGPELEPLSSIVMEEWAAQLRQSSGGRTLELLATSEELGQLVADIEAARTFGFYAAWRHDRSQSINAETAMLKLWTARLREQLSAFALRMFSQAEPITVQFADTRTYFENMYLAAPLFKFGAGGLEILQDIIAESALAMPRSR